ncbi:DUF5103 domain-containing protein [Chitinophagaceae bacterium LWZ2-11]
MRQVLTLLLFLTSVTGRSQRQPDHTFMNNIGTPQLYQQNNPIGLPIIKLNSGDKLELHFDDLDGDVKSYYYTFELCNADWQPADVSSFDYIKGYTQSRLLQYRISSIVYKQYVHFQALLPEATAMPTRSGNYLLKVFLDGDTSKLAFTKRMFVVGNKVTVGTQILTPFDNNLGTTHQKIQISINLGKLDPFSATQQVKMVVLQNYRWDNAVVNMQPSFIRGNILEYNGEQDFLFPAGKEYRWVDLRSFRYESERIAGINRTVIPYEIYVRPDPERTNQRYVYYLDYNGFFFIDVTESVNPLWQGDYGHVHFVFAPADHHPFPNKEVHMVGALTGNQIGDSSLMKFDENKGVYEKTMLLKQGYYSYNYVTKDRDNPKSVADATLTDGNNWETSNDYTVLVYYRSFSDRADQLVAISTVNSKNNGLGL